MISLSTIGAKVIAKPMDDVQYWKDKETPWTFISGSLTFQVCIERLLVDDDFVFGAAGTVGNGPELFVGLTCSLTLRSAWLDKTEGSANFRIGPGVVHRNPDYDPAENGNVEWYHHPEGIKLEGFPRFNRMAHIYAVQARSNSRWLQ